MVARRKWYGCENQACENERVRKEVERLYRRRLDLMDWKQDP